MSNIEIKGDIICCPKCKCEILKDNKCQKCGASYNYSKDILRLIDNYDEEHQTNNWDFVKGTENKTIEELIELDRELQEKLDKIKCKEHQELEIVARKRIKELLNDKKGITLDLATGRGMMLNNLLSMNNKDFSIVCVDISEDILSRTKKINGTENGRISYYIMDALNMAIKDESIDQIVSMFGIANIPNTEDLVKELYRILKPNGSVVIETLMFDKDSKSYDISKKYNIEKALNIELLTEIFKKAGFSKVSFEVIGEYIGEDNELDLIPVCGDRTKYVVTNIVK